MKKYLILMAFMIAPMVANAGFIARDGNEWEFRGSMTDVAGHTVEAAADTGWMWASSNDWAASGLDFRGFNEGPGLDAFEGVCDSSIVNCLGYFSDACPVQFCGPSEQWVVFCVMCFANPSGELISTFAVDYRSDSATFLHRLSFRPPTAAVPEPTSAALLGLSLLGLGLARKIQHKT